MLDKLKERNYDRFKKVNVNKIKLKNEFLKERKVIK